MSELRWFRLHTNSIDNVKLRMLAFEDRWHYIAICCLKAEGLLDKSDDKNFLRKIAIKLGVQALDLEEVKRRLIDAGLIDDLFQPVGWSKHQYLSDNSTERVRKHRAGKKETPVKRFSNVPVTPPDTETEAEAEAESEAYTEKDKDKPIPKLSLVEEVEKPLPNCLQRSRTNLPQWREARAVSRQPRR